MGLDSEKSSTSAKLNEAANSGNKREDSWDIAEKAVEEWHGKQLRNRLVPPPGQPHRVPRKTRTTSEAAAHSSLAERQTPREELKESLEDTQIGGSSRRSGAQVETVTTQILKTSGNGEPTVGKSGTTLDTAEKMESSNRGRLGYLERSAEVLQRVAEQENPISVSGSMQSGKETDTFMDKKDWEPGNPLGPQDRVELGSMYRRILTPSGNFG